MLRVSKQAPSERALDEAAGAAADFGAAADLVDEAAADRLGINRTDLRLLGEIHRAGARTAGALAEAAGLSPAATTTAIQRLVRAGYAERRTDGADRRRVAVTLTPRAAELLDRIYTPIATEGRRELRRYATDELALLTRFLQRGRELQLAWAAKIRTEP